MSSPAKQSKISRFFGSSDTPPAKRSLSPIDLTLDDSDEAESRPPPPKKAKTSQLKKAADASTSVPSASLAKRSRQGVSDTDPERESAQKKRRDAFKKKLLRDNSLLLRGDHDEPEKEPTASRSKPRLQAAENDEDTDEDSFRAITDKFAHGPKKAKRKTGSTSKSKKKDIIGPSGLPYTPLELQVVQLKKEHPGVLLMVEVGYKYKFFGKDAQIAADELAIVCFTDRNFDVASIPTHRLKVHLKKLISKGHKVGVVDQLETAALKKVGDNRNAPFVRKLSRLYTAATYIDDLDSVDDVELYSPPAVMCIKERKIGAASDDKAEFAIIVMLPPTGEISWDHFTDSHMRIELETRFAHAQPKEILLPKQGLSQCTEKMVQRLANETHGDDNMQIERFKDDLSYTDAFAFVTEFYTKSHGTNHLNCGRQLALITALPESVVVALAHAIKYMAGFDMADVFLQAQFFSKISSRTHMLLSASTLTNLEIYRNETDYTRRGALISLLDYTQTRFGARMLKDWIGRPLVDKEALQKRVDAVEEILKSASSDKIIGLRNTLKSLSDLSKGLSQIQHGKMQPQGLATFLRNIQALSELYDPVDDPSSFSFKSSIINGILSSVSKLQGPVKDIFADISVDKASKGLKNKLWLDPDKFPKVEEYELLITSVEIELRDELKAIRKQLKKPSLKWTTNGTDEYLVQFEKHEEDIIPDDWYIVSRTTYFLRYHKPSVKSKVERRAQYLESLKAAADDAYSRFLREICEKHYERLREAINQVAVADCLFSLCRVAGMVNYVRPQFTNDDILEINEGRHPMIESLNDTIYLPNDVSIGGKGAKAIVCTGPNMGGKSSLVRMVALLAIMSQIGSYVPATSMRIGMLDGIYTRMGASDNLARGKSTFMVEMTETSDILRSATSKSLVILDELGRGTSTFDGMAVASAVLQHLVEETKAKTLFITHYPSIAMELERKFPQHVRNHHMSYMESSRPDGTREITFLYRLVPGVTTNSFGIECARLAGVAAKLLEVAERKSSELRDDMRLRVRKNRARKCAQLLQKCLSGEADTPTSTFDTLREIVSGFKTSI